VGRPWHRGARRGDADRLPPVSDARLHLVVARLGDAGVDCGAVQPTGERRATVVRDRWAGRVGDSAVGAGEAERDLLHRRAARAAHASDQRAGILGDPDCRRRRVAGRADSARARLRDVDVGGGDRRGDGVRGRPRLHLYHRRRAGNAPGGRVPGDQRGITAPPDPDLSQSVGRPARRRVSDHPIADRRRYRRRVGQGADERRAEAVLPARAAHRFHLWLARRRWWRAFA
jgi:hypothetical protein